MKLILASIAASTLLAAFAIAQAPHDRVVDLGVLAGGTFSQASFVNNEGIVTGVATAKDGTQHSVFWYQGWIGDLGPSAFGGTNSEIFGINEKDQADGQAESSTKDPNGENFCGYGTGFECLPFLWQRGASIPLPLLGGNNGTIGNINRRSEIAGISENSTRDSECISPQVLDFDAVIWGPKEGEIRELHPLPGDSVAEALWINDKGQAVGASGSCSNTELPPLATGPHAVIWDADGSVTDLGNLGGTANPAVPGVGNIGLSINNHGQVAGASALTGSTTTHAFLWTRETGMHDLGTLPGDVQSAGTSINDRAEVVGPSVDGSGNLRAFLWKDGRITDLNTLIPADSPLFLLFPSAINSRGEIAGFGATSTGDIHAFLAIPMRNSSSMESNATGPAPPTQKFHLGLHR
jgi:probable HAF family extracellular repeat protein